MRTLAAAALLCLCAPASPAGAEIFVASDGAIRVFADGADGDVAPLRSIAGAASLVAEPTNVTLDLVHRELFVSDSNRILVYAMDAAGDVAPLRVIEGANALLHSARGTAIDLVADELYAIALPIVRVQSVSDLPWVDEVVTVWSDVSTGRAGIRQ